MDVTPVKVDDDTIFSGLSTPIREGVIVGMGNTLLDLIGYVDEYILKKYSLIANHGCLAADEHLPLFAELKAKFNARYVVGGSTQNTLRVTQRILKVPKACIIYGGIGCDEEGTILVNQASADGVDTKYQYIKDVPTGVCAVLLTKGGSERTLVANLSAANCFTLDHLLRPENKCRLETASIIYITGFFLAVSPDSVELAGTVTHHRDAWFTMNLSAVYVAQTCMHAWDKVMPYVDILFGNDAEARVFAELRQFTESSDLSSVALELSKMPKLNSKRARMVVITCGSDSVIVAHDGIITKFPVIELSPEQVVDTTGAGDAFVGGFLGQMVLGERWQECVRCGIWCAAQVVQRQGCSLDDFAQYEPASS